MSTPIDNRPLIIGVDDEKINLALLSFIMRKIDYRFIGIQDSTQAVTRISELKPDLILLDILMDEMDGFQICEEIKDVDELKEIPIIFVTGRNSIEDKIRGLQLGGVDYVTKPFNEHELNARIKTHLDLALAKVQIEKQAAKLTQDNILLNRMFSIIGHDLRSPLSAIKMQLDFVLRGMIDPKSEFFMQKTVVNLSSTADEAFNLLDNLLGWAKSETGVLYVIKEDLPLIDIIEQTARLQKMALENKQITLNVDVSKDAVVFADFNTTKTVIVNLISNAIKFTPRGGTISIKVYDINDGWKTEISDTGVGISPNQLNEILDPKKHFSQTGTENESGTGLGLILCQDFLIKNDSKLHIESTVDVGSTFSFVLPKFVS
ncbi:hybrid sensor histidine kinase/response regulator [Neptunitalea chrysea]|uniref:histidine kinase n=1 Tax=Neptunitalea chrysea TaxID=1647581 RepID=A0A9W6B2R6_9FLAO|nr:hybrid sensor histidine kinase/response regulator [Neptunitalea chrysea]GLB51318.1 hybrid sensor histidine kinase/response regulator [Neptunitalea chrysea]